MYSVCNARRLYKSLQEDLELPSSPLIRSYLPAESVCFLPAGLSTFETLRNISGSNLSVFGFDHRWAFQVLISLHLRVCEQGGVYCRHLYFSLWSVVLVISLAVNQCLHPGRPEDMPRIVSFLSPLQRPAQSLSNLLLRILIEFH